METKLQIDDKGFPVLLADVPNSGGVVTRKTGTEGGNEQHDASSGKFAPGSAQGDPLENVPANTDVNAYRRKLDAVRDLAREMDDIEAGDVQDFLAGRLTRPLTVEELNQFILEVRQQKLNDLVDILDYQFRSLIDSIKRGRRRVRVAAPKGWIRRTFNKLSDDEILSVINRLEARGHKREDLQNSVLGRLKKQDRVDKIGKRLAEIPENDETLELAFDDLEYIDLEDYDDVEANFQQILDTINNRKEQPVVVNVTVENKPTKKTVMRGSTGLIEEIIEEMQ